MDKNEKIQKNKEDIEIIKKILNGNTDLFAILEKRYSRIISSLIRRMVKDEDDVSDLTQETLIKAYKALHSFQFNYSCRRCPVVSYRSSE